MKKIIAIALIAIMAVTAAFAATGKIKVTYSVTDAEPTFSLSTGTGETAISVTATDAGAEATSAHAITASLADGGSASESVTFTVSQAKNIARSHKTYTLTVSATDLIIVENNAQKASPATNEKFTMSGITDVTKTDTRSNVTSTADNENKKFTCVYDGRVVAGAVGTFKATWTANDTAKAGNYLAYVTLTVASN